MWRQIYRGRRTLSTSRVFNLEREPRLRGGSETDHLALESPDKPIIRYLLDAANLLSLAGLFGSICAIGFALNGRFPEAGVCLMLAFLADVYDGPVAKRLTSRTASDRAFGANLDSLIDIIGAGVVPGLILISYSGFSGWYLPGAFLMLAAAALRLSYFNVFGMGESATHYTGVPTDLILLSFACLLLTDEILSLAVFRVVLYVSCVVLAALMVSAFRVPKLIGGWYYVLPVIAGGIALLNVARIVA